VPSKDLRCPEGGGVGVCISFRDEVFGPLTSGKVGVPFSVPEM